MEDIACTIMEALYNILCNTNESLAIKYGRDTVHTHKRKEGLMNIVHNYNCTIGIVY